jgi:hypothetical protein
MKTFVLDTNVLLGHLKGEKAIMYYHQLLLIKSWNGSKTKIYFQKN